MGASQLNNFGDSDAMFKERLKNMGKMSKKKFSQIARLFSGRTKKNFRHLNDSNTRNPYLYEDLNDNNYEEGSSRNNNTNKPSSSNIWNKCQLLKLFPMAQFSSPSYCCIRVRSYLPIKILQSTRQCYSNETITFFIIF